MTNFFNRFASDESGVTAMEYGMIAALIAVIIIGVVGQLGDELNVTFGKVKDAIEAANTKATPAS